ncbi:MAG TPA: ABC transporter permease, partial [Gemmiger qucibialis]|nr:ABC transporter permease [Gemmiger qucibialis]
VNLRLLPAGGFPGWSHPGAALKALILPAIALALPQAAILARVLRSALVETLGQDYIRTARAKGLTEFAVVTKHALRNALIPVITVLGPTVAGLLTGSFVVEKIFAIPGIGYYFVNSVTQRDYTTIMGVTIFFAAFLMAMVLLVDIFYCLIDPRIKFDA